METKSFLPYSKNTFIDNESDKFRTSSIKSNSGNSIESSAGSSSSEEHSLVNSNNSSSRDSDSSSSDSSEQFIGGNPDSTTHIPDSNFTGPRQTLGGKV